MTSPTMTAWERLSHVQLSWVGLATNVVALVLLIALRRWLPPDLRGRSKAPIFFLIVDLLLRIAAASSAAAGLFRAWGVLNLLGVLFLAFGVSGVADMLVFDFVLRRFRVRFPSVLRDLLQAFAFVVAILLVVRRSGVNLLHFVTTSAVLTAVVGLALQSTLANLFAGLSLQLERNVGIGDWVQAAGRMGQVLQTRWRSTTIQTRDGDLVVLPNSLLLSQDVVNYSRPTPAHRVSVRVGFHYRHPPNEVRDALLPAVAAAPGVLPHPAPDCFPVEFGDSAIVYAIRYWIRDFAREEAIGGEVLTRIWYASKRAGLEIPFPIRTVLMTEMTEEKLSSETQLEFAERLALLSRIDLFRPLDAADRTLLAEGMRQVRFARGEEIIRQGEPGDSLYLIQSGDVSVQLTVDGHRSEVARLGAGQFFGEMSLVTGEPRAATCAAQTDVTCYVIDHAAMERVLAARPQLAEEISAVLGERQLALESERSELSAEARARRAAEESRRLLVRIRQFFQMGG